MLEQLNKDEMDVLHQLYYEKITFHKQSLDAVLGQAMNLAVASGQDVSVALKTILSNKIQLMSEIKESYDTKKNEVDNQEKEKKTSNKDDVMEF